MFIPKNSHLKIARRDHHGLFFDYLDIPTSTNECSSPSIANSLENAHFSINLGRHNVAHDKFVAISHQRIEARQQNIQF